MATFFALRRITSASSRGMLGMLLRNLFFFFLFLFLFLFLLSGRREISTTRAHEGRKGEEASPPARSL